MLPRKLGLTYVDEDGKLQTPVIVHYSAIGSYQRFISIILEQTQGKLPFWISPIQLVLLPLLDNKENTDEVDKMTDNLFNDLKKEFRIEIWSHKRLGNRIRRSHQLKIPFYIVIGTLFDLEFARNSISCKFETWFIICSCHPRRHNFFKGAKTLYNIFH